MMGASARAASEDETGMIDMERVRNRNQNRSTVVSANGMVCASQPLAAMVGVDILKSGGNAVDAAIGVNAMLGLVEPPSNGLGGDLFAILWLEKDRRLYGLNASGRSPYDWSLKDALDMGLESIPGNSPLAWSVPGCVSGWGALSERFGMKPLADVLAPAIRYATEGFPLSPLISRSFGFDGEKYPTLAETFQPHGNVPKYGDMFKNPGLARSLKTIAEEGWRAFYEGEIADGIVKHSEENGGRFTKKDFEDHTFTWVDPVSSSYRGYDVWEIPPNGQGIAALQILNMLETFDIGSLDANSAEHLHLFVEAKKLAFEDRAIYYADPEFADVPVEWLISKEYAKARARLIDPRKAATRVGAGDPQLDSDTIYMTAADSDGNMISLIQSNYAAWGSRIVPGGLGFPIQNRGQSFALAEAHRNRLEPHKRPFHTIIPAFMTKDGRPVWSFGVMGGDFQPQGHAQVVMNVVDFGMSPQQAGEQPRLRHLGSSSPTGKIVGEGGSLQFEHHFSESVKEKLAAMGHDIMDRPDAHGGYQSIWREEDPRRYFGGSDPRKDGMAIGY
ncbi:MAG: gamma-glutamyltransferase [Candidatus Hydrogenedentes bacterium]|nr:gamma-glutamyltransferase [Candidatus Hydrogenedentota bacterium]